jgi:hypothetical protein
VLRLGDPDSPNLQHLFPTISQPPLAPWAPLQAASVIETLDGSAALARSENFLVPAPAEIPKLIRVEQTVQLHPNRLVKVLIFVPKLGLLFFADSACPDGGSDRKSLC